MITKNTVLIPGAGVSTPYDYPSGYGVLVEIIEGLRLDENIFQRIHETLRG